MSPNKSSFLRYLVGSGVGGIVAASASALTFMVFVQFPPETSPSRHDAQAALALIVLMMLFAGDFIGGRGIAAEYRSDLLPSVLWSFGIIGFLCLLAGWGSFGAFAGMLGLASVGICSSAGASLLVLHFFPLKEKVADEE